MARIFALKGKRPRLSVPDEGETHQCFIVSFQEHYDTIDLSLATYSLSQAPGKSFYACSIRCSPCCSMPIPSHRVEDYVSTLLESTLPGRRWVIAEYAPSPYPHSGLIGGRWSRGQTRNASLTCCKRSAVSSLKRAPDDGFTPVIVADASNTRPPKRTRTQIIGQEEEEEEERQAAESDDEREIDKKIRFPAKSLAGNFVAWLGERGRKEKKHCGREEIADDRTVAMRKTDFVSSLINYRRVTRNSDDGQELETMMQDEIRRIAKTNRQAVWILWYSSTCVQLLRDSEEPYYSETGNSKKEKVERHKRNACLIFNGIVNGLWTTWGQRALVFYHFLAGKIVDSGSPQTVTNTNQRKT